MRSLLAFITTAKRNQAIGLLAIGATVLLCSQVAEAEIPAGAALECTQTVLILAGIVATAVVFRARGDREKYK